MRHRRQSGMPIIRDRSTGASSLSFASRSGVGVVTNGFSSIIGLAIAVFIAHSSGVSGLGEYGLTFAVFGLSLGVSGAVGAMSVLSLLPDDVLIRRFGGRVSLVGILSAAAALTIGIFAHSAYLIVLGLCLHGMLLHDYARKVKTALGKGLTALAIEGLLLVMVLAVALVVVHWRLPPVSVFAAWCVGSLISGYAQAILHSIRLAPDWKTGAGDSRSAVIFGLENVSGAGTGHLLIAAISSLFSLNVVGALRGAGTVLGPANLISATVQPLLLSPLARARENPRMAELKRVAFLGSTVTMVVAMVALPLLLIPREAGYFVLGEVWDDARSVLAMLCLECVATAASVVAMAGHRVYGEASRLMVLSLALIPFRIIASLGGGYVGGAQGIATGMAAVAILSALLYWFSYATLIGGQKAPLTQDVLEESESSS